MKDKVTSASSESEIGIDAIPTATKPRSIVDWKIIPQTCQKAVYQIIRSNVAASMVWVSGSCNRVEKDCLSVGLATTQQMVIKLATPEQTPTGKEISNLLIADSLLKTIRSDEMLLKIKSQNSEESSSSAEETAMVKHTRVVGFALNSLTKEAQAVTSRNDSLAILECTQFDQTATIEAPMIKRFDGQD
ncbi:hypothetical protein Tco_1275706 [Tanacetum coccineum]